MFFLLSLSFMLGLSLLLPWNSLLKSLPYIMTRIPVEWLDTAPLLLTLTFTFTNCVVLLILTLSDADSRLIRRIRGGFGTERIVGGRLYGGLIGCSLLLGLSCVIPLMDLFADNSGLRSSGTPANLFLFWGIFVLSGVCMCLLQRSVYPLMSLLPGRKESLIPSMLTGQAVAGISASLGSFLLTGTDERGGAGMALIYFGSSIAVLLLTAALYKYYELQVDGKMTLESGKEQPRFSLKILWETARSIGPWPQLLALNFAVTLTLFPGLLTSCARSLRSNPYFIPLTFLIFDIFDLIGKVMPSIVSNRGLGPKSLVAKMFPVARILFVPALLVLPNFSKTTTTPVSFKSDSLYFSVLALMAWTSGWGNAICLINGPQSVNDASEEIGDRIGSLMGLSITFGLLAGSGISFILKTFLF